MLFKAIVVATALAAGTLAQAQSSPAKKELVAKVLQLQQPGLDGMARALAMGPVQQMSPGITAALQQVPPERREALARDIEADVRKYVDDTTPLVRDRAMKLAPTTIGSLLEERFTEDELRQLVTLLESPVNRKFQTMGGDMQKVLGEKLVAELRPEVDAKIRVLEQSVRSRLAAPAGDGTAAAPPAPAAARRPASGPARKP